MDGQNKELIRPRAGKLRPREVGVISSSNACHTQSHFLDLICFYGAIGSCVKDELTTDKSTTAYPGQGGKCFKTAAVSSS